MKHKPTSKRNPKQHFPHQNQDGHSFNNNNKIQVKATFEIGNKHTKYVLSLKAAKNVFYWLLLEVGCYKNTSKVELQTENFKENQNVLSVNIWHNRILAIF